MIVCDVLDSLDWDRIIGLLALAHPLVACKLLLDGKVSLVACVLCAPRQCSGLDTLLVCKIQAHVIPISRARILRAMPRRRLHKHGHVWIDEEPVRLIADRVIEL